MTGNTPREDTHKMIAGYLSQHAQVMREMHLKVAEWGWLNIDTAINFLIDLKKHHHADGLRIYFATHVADVTDPIERYEGYNTAVLVGTHKDSSGQNQDVDETSFTEASDYALKIGYDGHGIDDLDRSHLHPPDNDDTVEAIRQKMYGKKQEQKQTN